MSELVWRRINPGRYAAGERWEVRRTAPGAWSVFRWDVGREDWVIVIGQLSTKTEAMANADALRRMRPDIHC